MTSQPRDLERTVQRSGIERLRVIGVVLYRRNVMTIEAEHKGKTRTIRAARRGQADTYGWIISTGVHVEIEWKRYGERPTKEQVDWLKECTRLGAVAFWADNVSTAETVMKAILRGGRIIWFEDGHFDVEMKP